MAKRKVTKARTVRASRFVRDTFDWDAFEQALTKGRVGQGTRRGVPAASDAAFAEGEIADLRRLAERSRLVRSRNPVLGNVVFLHGITGSDLAVFDAKGDADPVWVSASRLILGHIEQLRLDPTGNHETDPKYTGESPPASTRSTTRKLYWRCVRAGMSNLTRTTGARISTMRPPGWPHS